MALKPCNGEDCYKDFRTCCLCNKHFLPVRPFHWVHHGMYVCYKCVDDDVIGLKLLAGERLP